MRHVTNVILTSDLYDKGKIDQLNALPWYPCERGLVSCADKRFEIPWYGGNKHLEINIWIGAFRELDLDALVSAIRHIEWDEPECVRLYVSQGDRGRFARIDWQEQAP